jgi:hypothetical protein
MKGYSSIGRAALAVGFIFATAGAVNGLVLTEKSPEQKQRKDIQKQSNKNTLCMAKALVKCEDNGAALAVECNAQNPAASTVPDPDDKIIPKLTADLLKCESKLALSKKSATGSPVNDYTAIGCPGDSVMGGADNPYTDLTAFQAGVGPNTRFQLDLLTGIIASQCDTNACTVLQGTIGLAYAKALLKCIEKCENDYKDKKGNGGGDDLLTKCSPTGGDANFTACSGKALAKGQAKGPLNPGVKVAIDSAIADASNDLYNQDDCP